MGMHSEGLNMIELDLFERVLLLIVLGAITGMHIFLLFVGILHMTVMFKPNRPPVPPEPKAVKEKNDGKVKD